MREFLVRIPEDLDEWLRQAAFDRRVPKAQLVREALEAKRTAEMKGGKT